MKTITTALSRSLLLPLVAMFGICAVAQAAIVNVNCNANKNNSINVALGKLNKRGPNTVRVSGNCNEAVVIDGFDRLTLEGNPTATINDPTPSPDPDLEDTTVVDIQDSDHVNL